MPPPDAVIGSAEGLERLRERPVELLVREDLAMSSAPVAVEVVRGLGFEARAVVEREATLEPGRILLVSGSTRAYRGTLERVAALPRGRRPLVVVWHTEPLPMPRAAGLRAEPPTLREAAKIALRDRRINDHWSNGRYLRALAGARAVDVFAVATRAYQAYLAEHGVETTFVPLGWHPSFGRLLEPPLERDVDVLFLGDYRLRRRRRALRRLRREGLDVVTLGDYSNPALWGESRTQLMNRTKIALNIPRLEGHLPDMRFVVAMATGALLASEPVYLPEPYVPGRHYVEAPPDRLAATVRRYLDDDEARGRVTAAAHDLVTRELTLERSFEAVLALAAAQVTNRAE